MRILDINDVEVVNPDLSLGYLKGDKILIKHHDAVPEIKEKWHRELIKEYPNGGKDYVRVVDVPGSCAKDPWDEYEDICRYILYTKEELEKLNQPSPDEDRDSMLVDMEYRLTLLEIGV